MTAGRDPGRSHVARLIVCACLAFPLFAQSEISYDVIVAGGGAGGVAAALQAARMGLKVALVEPTDWLGGQMSAAGVSTMDDSVVTMVIPSGIYREFLNLATQSYLGRGINISTCYFSPHSRCFEPRIVQQTLKTMIEGQRIDLYLNTEVTELRVEGSAVRGVTLNTGISLLSRVVIDATEYGDLLPLSFAPYRAGNTTGRGPAPTPKAGSCIQDITYTAVIQKYAQVPEELRFAEKPPNYDFYFQEFQRTVKRSGFNDGRYPVSFAFHNLYRGMPSLADLLPGFLTGVNWANDWPNYSTYNPVPGIAVTLPIDFLINKSARSEMICQAKAKTLAFLYYINDPNGLNEPSWAISDQFTDSTAHSFCANLPPAFRQIERRMPLIPYVRESMRAVTIDSFTIDKVRRTRDAGDGVYRAIPQVTAVAVGGYGIDLHNCNTDASLESELGETSRDLNGPGGPFQVPFGALIAADIDGLVVAEKNYGSRLTNGATRVTTVMDTGMAAGAIAAIAARMNLPPRMIPPALVQDAVARNGGKISLYEYDDVPYGSSYWADAQLVSARRIMVGKSLTHFGASESLTRAETAALVARIAKLPILDPAGLFQDLPATHWAAPFAEALYRAGVTKGCSSAPLKYCPDDTILREQFAAFLTRGVGLSSSTLGFDDVSPALRPFVASVVAAQVMEPCSTTRFCGSDLLLRREAARAMARVLVRPPY